VSVRVDRPQQQPQRVPPWRNVTFLKWAAQIIALVTTLGLGYLLVTQAQDNLAARNIDVSFDFLRDPPGIQIAEGIDIRPSTAARALFVGIVNMLRVTLAGIVGATILGVLLGVARLSSNWIVSKVATVYIETIRNIPLLVQIIFWGAVVTIGLPDIGFDTGPFGCNEAVDGCEGWLFASNRGVSTIWFFPADGFWQWVAWMAIGIFASIKVYKWRLRLKEETGAETYSLTWGTLTVVVFAVVGFWVHPIMGFLGWIFGGLASLFDSLPSIVIQLILAGLSVLAGAWWIKRFLDSRRTPAGLAKLTDDDLFRIGAAAVLGLVGAFIAFSFTGISNYILDAGRDFFEVADDKFEFLRTGGVFDFRRPSLAKPGNFVNYGTTGLTMSKLFFPVFVGVTLYTAAFIAEIVRGGILAISKGQTEAGLALGLTRFQLLRFVILPQAFRIILPPMGNQYLNVAKNTSLGIAVAYPEVVAVGQTLYNQTGATIPVVTLWMLFYVSVSLTISAVVNFFNNRMKLVER
jgi:general L-amino acid transport system permease protein